MILHDRIETVDRIAVPGEFDQYGNQVTVETRSRHRAEVQPLSSAENVVAGQQVQTRYRVFLPVSSTLTATSAVYWDGVKYEIEGDVELHKLIGRPHHKEAVLSRVSG